MFALHCIVIENKEDKDDFNNDNNSNSNNDSNNDNNDDITNKKTFTRSSGCPNRVTKTIFTRVRFCQKLCCGEGLCMHRDVIGACNIQKVLIDYARTSDRPGWNKRGYKVLYQKTYSQHHLLIQHQPHTKEAL